MARPENIILIVVDCLRKDYAVNEKLMSFVNKTFKYKNEAYTNAPSTHFAVPALLTGKVPFEITNRPGIHNDNVDYYLPKLLKRGGYKTIFLTANAVTSAYFGYNKYVDYFEDFIDQRNINKRRIETLDYITSFVPQSIKKFNIFPIHYLRKKYQEMRTKQNIDLKSKISSKEILYILKQIKLKSSKNFIFLHLMETHPPYLPKFNLSVKDVKKMEKLTYKLYLEDYKLKQRDIHLYRCCLFYMFYNSLSNLPF